MLQEWENVCVICVEGQKIKTNGTPCADTVCECKYREGYITDGHYCTRVDECLAGHEMSPRGTFFSWTHI